VSSKPRKRSPDTGPQPPGGPHDHPHCSLVAADGRASLTGPLTFETVARLFHALEQGPSGAPQIGQIDLAGVGAIDSAGLALLLEWQSRARSLGGPLEVLNAPDSLLRLARLCEAVDLLNISGRGSGPRPGTGSGAGSGPGSGFGPERGGKP
jgi:phospholipid transport system transporter-binding protein